MSGKEQDGKHGHFVDAGRAESEIFEADPEIAEVFESDKHGHGARAGGRLMQDEIREQHGYGRELNAGDPDVVLEDAAFVGEEGVGGGNSTPDQDVVDEIGQAAGLEYQASEELHTAEKIEARDRHRWEMDPASSEDYGERSRDLGSSRK